MATNNESKQDKSADLQTKVDEVECTTTADESKQQIENKTATTMTTTAETLSSPSSSWSWSSLLETAKQKSAEAYEFMKKDLTELKDAVKEDTTMAVSSTADYIRSASLLVSSTLGLNEEEEEENDDEKKKKLEGDESGKAAGEVEGEEANEKVDYEENTDDLDAAIKLIEEKAKSVFFSVLDVLRGVDTIQDENSSEICVVLGEKMLQISAERWNLLLSSIQNDPETYLHEPKGPPETYENWLEKFNLFDYQQQIENLINNEKHVENFYKTLVPKSISSDEFWHRYFYRVHQLLVLEEMRQQQQQQQQQQEQLKDEQKQKTNDVIEKTTETVEITKFDESAAAANVSSISSNNQRPAIAEQSSKVPLKQVATEKQQLQPPQQQQKQQKQQQINKKVKSDIVVVNKEGNVTSIETDESSSSSKTDGSDGWEKTELNDIVDEASKRVTEKLKLTDDKQQGDEFGEWDWQE